MQEVMSWKMGSRLEMSIRESSDARSWARQREPGRAASASGRGRHPQMDANYFHGRCSTLPPNAALTVEPPPPNMEQIRHSSGQATGDRTRSSKHSAEKTPGRALAPLPSPASRTGGASALCGNDFQLSGCLVTVLVTRAFLFGLNPSVHERTRPAPHLSRPSFPTCLHQPK